MKKRKSESQGVDGGRGAALRTMSALDQEQATPERKPRRRDDQAAAPKTKKQASERLTISVRADDMVKLKAFSERNLTSPPLMVRRIVERWIEEHQDLFKDGNSK